jgi:hypothetical protein
MESRTTTTARERSIAGMINEPLTSLVAASDGSNLDVAGHASAGRVRLSKS